MKMKLVSEYKGALDFLMVPVRCPDCDEERHVKLAFGMDGTVWIDPQELGIGPQHAAQLEQFGEPYLLTCPGTGETMINARAVLKVRTDPDWCRRWVRFIEGVIKEHREVRTRYEAAMRAPNN